MNLYGLTLVFAIFISYSFTAYRAKKRGLSTQIVWDSLPWVLVFGILGARLYHVLNYWSYYSQNLILIPQIWLGGLGILGAVAGGLVGLLIYFKISSTVILSSSERRISFVEMLRFVYLSMTSGWGPFSSYLDAAAPAIILGQAVGRVGNLFNRENLPYAWWEILLDLSIFLILIIMEWLMNNRHSDPAQPEKNLPARSAFSSADAGGDPSGRRPQDDGRGRRSFQVSMFKLYLLLYSAGRFGLEFLRRDSPWIWGPLTVAQWVCLGVIFSITIKAVLNSVKLTFRSRI